MQVAIVVALAVGWVSVFSGCVCVFIVIVRAKTCQVVLLFVGIFFFLAGWLLVNCRRKCSASAELVNCRLA